MLITAELYSGEILEYKVHPTTFTVGRSPKCEVVIPLEGLSRQHLSVQFKDGDFFITDLGSMNGVFINGERIQPDVRVKYNTFFPLSFGPVKNFHILFEQTTILNVSALQIPVPEITPKPKAHEKTYSGNTISALNRPPTSKNKSTLKKQSMEDSKYLSSRKLLINIIIIAIIMIAFIKVYKPATTTKKKLPKVEVQEASSKEDYF